MNSYAISVTAVVGATIVDPLNIRVDTHLGIPHQAPFTTSATKVMMNDDPITNLHVTYTSAHLRYHATWFMSTSFELRRVTPFRLGCSITVEVAATQSRSLHLNNRLKEIRLGIGKLLQLHFSFTEKNDASHVNLSYFISNGCITVQALHVLNLYQPC
jgi:hypothetical protein